MSYVNLPFSSLAGPKQVICAKGSLLGLVGLGASRVALICSERLSQNETILKLLASNKRTDFKVFNPSWNGEPTLSTMKKTIGEIEEFAPDYIVAIGGGRILDGAKIVWALYENPLFPIERLNIAFSLPELRKKAKFCAVPTTIGTGSEASSAAVLLDDINNVKIPIVTHCFLPDLVLLDTDMISDLPDSWRCITALDALSHAIEGHMSNQHNPVVDALVVPAVKMILESLKEYKNTNTKLSLERINELALMGAYYAGIIQNVLIVGPAHAIAHQMGDNGIPHGLATGLLLPRVLEYYSSVESDLKEKLDSLGKAIGLESGSELISTLTSLPLQFGVATSFNDWTPQKMSTSDLAKKAQGDLLSRFFPIQIPNNDLEGMIQKVWK